MLYSCGVGGVPGAREPDGEGEKGGRRGEERRREGKKESGLPEKKKRQSENWRGRGEGGLLGGEVGSAARKLV